MDPDEKVILVFGEQTKSARDAQAPQPVENIELALNNFISYFKGFKVKTIELSVSGAVESGGFLKIFVSAKAEAAASVTLEPE